MRRSWLLLSLCLIPAIFADTIPGRYIVELTTEPVTDQVARTKARGGLRSAEAGTHRSRIRGEQRELRGRLEARRARILDQVDTVANAMFVEMTDAEATQLASQPGVKRVLPVRRLRMVLDHAVSLHKVVEAWNQTGGGDRAGLGIKIAIVDSGVDPDHPGLRGSPLTAPDSFPRSTDAGDIVYTSGKVIVARSYVNMLPSRDPDLSARDRVGHGTALAVIAAGVRNAGPLATITGVAPAAWIGSYKVFGTPGTNDGTTDDAVLKAIDDAVADGMDVINLSLGDDFAPRLEDDMEVQAIERATRAGVLVIAAAGNNGPGRNTISSPATAPSAIAVGATTNDRTFASSVQAAGLGSFLAVAGSGPAPATSVTAPFGDVAWVDGTGLACAPLPARSLTGRIAVIIRGSCTFETKLNNAQNAGAVGAMVYAAPDSPSAFGMSVGAATLPAEMVSFGDGIRIRVGLLSDPFKRATLQFTRSAVGVPGNLLMDFSASGPSVNAAIKPDLMAAGSNIYTGTQRFDTNGDMYSANGYIVVAGTSFSTPLVAGAAALLKSARPGLTVDQYRSLLINPAVQLREPVSVQQGGAGVLDVAAAVRSTVAAFPTSLGLGAGGASPSIRRTLTLTNVGASTEVFLLEAVSSTGGLAPLLAMDSVTLAPGAAVGVPLDWRASGLAAGPYEGYVKITGTASGTLARVPYWYAVASAEPAAITILSVPQSRRGTLYFRVIDGSGLSLLDAQPRVTVVSGTGTVRSVTSYDRSVPGLYGASLQLAAGSGANVLRIQAGSAFADVSVAGQ